MTLQYDTNRDALRGLLAAFSGNGETMFSRRDVYRTIVEHMTSVRADGAQQDPYAQMAAAMMEKRPEGAPSVIGASFGDLTGTPAPKSYWQHRAEEAERLRQRDNALKQEGTTPESDSSWHTLFNDVAHALGCLPSAFSDCNAHVSEKASALSSDASVGYWYKRCEVKQVEVDLLRQRCKALEVYADKLSQAPDKFKTFVHKRLDDAGVPHDPEPEHTAQHGCRISGRLNWLIERAKGVEDLTVPGLAFYYENRDCFLVHARDVSTAVYESYGLYVIHVLRNDPRHAKQYKAGDQFSCGISKTEPRANAYKDWELKSVKRILVDKP